MKKAIILIALFLLIATPAYAQYNIYLKNGSVIRGVSAYEEVNGEIRFRHLGGTVGIPVESILRIQEAKTGGVVIGPKEGAPAVIEQKAPVVPSYQQEPLELGPDTAPIKREIAQIDSSIARIDARTGEYEKMKEEYDRVRLRIEVLFQKGVAEAKKKNGDPAQWYLFLSDQERQWAQLNTLKKNKMKKELEQLEKRNAPLLKEKEQLLQQRADLEKQLNEIEASPF